jgi:hypothetical protein
MGFHELPALADESKSVDLGGNSTLWIDRHGNR